MEINISLFSIKEDKRLLIKYINIIIIFIFVAFSAFLKSKYLYFGVLKLNSFVGSCLT